MKRSLFFLLALTLGCSSVWADEPTPTTEPQAPPADNVFIEIQMVSLPREKALPLIRELMEPAKIEDGVAHVQQLLDAGTAKLVGWPIVTTQEGQRAVIEAVDEFRFATEYAQPTIEVYSGPSTAQQGNPPAKVETTKLAGIEYLATPNAFETRNVGVTVEVEPVIAPDRQHIALSLIPQHVRLLRMNKVTIKHEQSHDEAVVEQPEFDTHKTNTALTVKSGEHVLLGVYPAPDAPDTLELFILRAEIRPVK